MDIPRSSWEARNAEKQPSGEIQVESVEGRLQGGFSVFGEHWWSLAGRLAVFSPKQLGTFVAPGSKEQGGSGPIRSHGQGTLVHPSHQRRAQSRD